MNAAVYFDTSALAKWYINESGSDEVEKYLQEHGPVAISDLTVVEMRCLLARRRRDRNIPLMLEEEIFATFQEDLRRGFLVCHTLPAGFAPAALNLMRLLSNLSVRTLDVLHLVAAREIPCEVIATSDRIMLDAAKALGMKFVRF